MYIYIFLGKVLGFFLVVGLKSFEGIFGGVCFCVFQLPKWDETASELIIFCLPQLFPM